VANAGNRITGTRAAANSFLTFQPGSIKPNNKITTPRTTGNKKYHQNFGLLWRFRTRYQFSVLDITTVSILPSSCRHPTMANLQHPLGASAAAHSAASTSHLNSRTIAAAAIESDSEASLIHLTPRPSLNATPSTRHVEDDSRRCWVCYSTEAEDIASGQPNLLGEWKSPCRCSLVAHEKCLLNWIAAEYAKGGKAKIECPQCKHRIKFKQERSVALEIIDGAVRVANATVPLIILCGM